MELKVLEVQSHSTCIGSILVQKMVAHPGGSTRRSGMLTSPARKHRKTEHAGVPQSSSRVCPQCSKDLPLGSPPLKGSQHLPIVPVWGPSVTHMGFLGTFQIQTLTPVFPDSL
jgi:hypothetical protein